MNTGQAPSKTGQAGCLSDVTTAKMGMIVKGDKVSEPGYPRRRRGQVGNKAESETKAEVLGTVGRRHSATIINTITLKYVYEN